MSRQLITMGMRMGSVPCRERWLFNGFMRGVGKGMVEGMMAGVFQVTPAVLAGPGFYGDFCITLIRF
jgi:hypothetical protein